MASGAGNQDIARRYASAFFDLAKEQSALEQAEKDMATLAALVAGGGDFGAFLQNTTYKRDDQAKAVVAVAQHLKLSALSEKFLGTLALKRRLPVLGDVVTAVQALIAQEKGEATADVTSAIALDDAQVRQIAEQLKKITGRTVKVNVSVDPAIIGGLIIRVGSQLMDSSVKTKLERLHRALKNSNEITDPKKMKEVA